MIVLSESGFSMKRTSLKRHNGVNKSPTSKDRKVYNDHSLAGCKITHMIKLHGDGLIMVKLRFQLSPFKF